MRRLMWFSLGFAAACGAGIWAGLDKWGLLIPGMVLLLAGIGLILGKVRTWYVAAALFLGAGTGMLWFLGFGAVHLADARNADQQILTVEARVRDYSRETGYGTLVPCRVTVGGTDYDADFYLNTREALSPGDRISGKFRFRLTIPGGAEAQTHHGGKGIFLLAYQKGKTVEIEQAAPEFRDFPAVLRHRIGEILDDCVGEDVSGLCRGLLLGDTSRLDYAGDTALKISGIRHIVAVSGLHVSIFFGILCMILGYRPWVNMTVGVPLLVILAAVTGATPSVVRACLMLVLLQLSLVTDREYDPATALAFAGLMILLHNPMTLASVSFQLSFGCVAGILMASGRIRRGLLDRMGISGRKGKRLSLRLGRWAAASCSVTLGSMVFTVPLSAWYFHSVSLVGVLSNLLLLPAVTVIFCGLLLTVLAGSIWLPLGAGIGWAVSWISRYVLWMAGALSRLPLAAVYTRSPYILLWLVYVYLLLGLFWFAKKKKPVLLVSLACLSLCVSLFASWLEPMSSPCRMTVLDVGQGQSLILHAGPKTFLVDCGGDMDRVSADLAAETLLSRGIRRLDGVIVTHFDRDHVGGVPYLLTRMRTDRLYAPEDDRLALTGSTVVTEKTELYLDGGTLTIYPGTGVSENDRSLAVLFQTENCDILITGDRSALGERHLLENYAIPDVEVLVAGHHGAASSTCSQLLETVKPETVFISCGLENRYGHPHPEILARLKAFGCDVYRTDLQGTIEYIR